MDNFLSGHLQRPGRLQLVVAARPAHTDPNSPVKPDVGPSVAKLVGSEQQSGQPLANAAAGLGTHLDSLVEP